MLLILLGGLSFAVGTTRAQDAPQAQAKPRIAIVSLSHPTDSRGEVVYEVQGDRLDQPAVPGVLVNPVAIKTPAPTYPKSLEQSSEEADVSVECVVAKNGDAIDARVMNSSNPDASASALETVQKYRFKPATLDGKPIASLIKVTVSFRQ